MSNNAPRFGRLLKCYRTAAGLTQDELAEQAGLSVRRISNLERGARERPHRDTVQLLAEALKLPAEDRERLFAAARPHGSADAPRPPAAAPTNLPVPLTSLIGRAEDTQAVGQLLQRPAVRLVTLTGTSGVGKTRLAVQVAVDLQEAFPDGTFFVELAALRDPVQCSQRLCTPWEY